jgi:hypothetical protein
MTRIRSFSERDLPAVASLYERVIRSGAAPPPELGQYFRRTFLDHPWVDPEIPSLVSEDDDGRIVGFIGSHVRRARFGGERIRIACSGQLVTAPEARAEAAGAFLLRRYMEGPQELTITDGANEPARRLWEALGGQVLHVASVDWIRVFRPASVAAEYAARGNGRPGRLLGPAARIADVAALPVRRRLGVSSPAGGVEELTPEVLVENLAAITADLHLYLEYDEVFLAWLFRELAAVRSRGRLVRTLVRGEDGRALGWYVTYIRPHGVADVVQVAAAERAVGTVLDRLFYEAQSLGAAALRGRVEPRLLPALWERRCLLRYTGGALVQSPSPELLRVVGSPWALLTRMDGEWWMGHHLDPLTPPRSS